MGNICPPWALADRAVAVSNETSNVLVLVIKSAFGSSDTMRNSRDRIRAGNHSIWACFAAKAEPGQPHRIATKALTPVLILSPFQNRFNPHDLSGDRQIRVMSSLPVE
jgi:hypothetical protein